MEETKKSFWGKALLSFSSFIFGIIGTLIFQGVTEGKWPAIVENYYINEFEKLVIGPVWEEEDSLEKWEFSGVDDFDAEYYPKGKFKLYTHNLNIVIEIYYYNDKNELITQKFKIKTCDEKSFTLTDGRKFNKIT